MFAAAFITGVMYAQQDALARAKSQQAEKDRLMTLPHDQRMAEIELMKVRAMQDQARALYSQANATRNQKLSVF